MREWLEATLSGGESVGLPWLTFWAFVRITTNPRWIEQPLRCEEALEVLSEVRANPLVAMVNPGRHQELLAEQLRDAQVRGPEVHRCGAGGAGAGTRSNARIDGCGVPPVFVVAVCESTAGVSSGLAGEGKNGGSSV